MDGRKLISIVTPCYNEEANVQDHFKRVSDAIAPLRATYDFEHIYTDNCSQDATFDLLKALAGKHPEVRALRFSRNIGPNRAVILGLRHASGDAAILIQADLQDPPEMIPTFVHGWEEGFDIVYGQVERRDESPLMQLGRRFYHAAVAALSDVPLPPNASEFRIVSRRVLDLLKDYHEDDLYLRGAIAHVGFPQKAIPFERQKRQGGRSSLNIFGLASYGINSLLSTTGVTPIRVVVIAGLLLATFGFVLTGALVMAKLLLPGEAPRGFTMLATLITFFAGAQLFAIGVIGEYIRKIYVQSLHLPRGFVQDRINIS